jgi:TrmH family RNA methyltransferase
MNDIGEIFSAGNELIKFCSKLKERRNREEQRLFIADGEKLCMEALRSGYLPYAAFATEKRKSLLPIFENASKYMISDQILKKLTDIESPQGILAVFHMEREEKAKTAPKKSIVLENMQDPGNFGTILRTAECFGIDCVITVGTAVDRFSAKVLRGSMGSALRMSIIHFETPEKLADYLKQNAVSLWAAVLDEGAIKLPDIPKGEMCAVAIGNEGMGLSRELIAAADKKVYIPMTGAAESLNAAVAAGILLWSMYQ